MAKRTSTPNISETTHFQYGDARRKNIPTAAMAAEGQLPKAKRARYAYSAHLDPVLRFDPTERADRVAAIVDKACRGERLDRRDQEILQAVGRNWEQPWLEWAGKREEHDKGNFGVDPVALHIHERISAQAILRNALREPTEPSLFAVPDQTYAEALQFYEHDVDWANRLILGDSVQVMSSLARRENLGGKVQMIYLDPPYGIRYLSNFQPELALRPINDKDSDLTRQTEAVRAYRDTWNLGTHSYCTYIRNRLLVSHDLLTQSGSLFVQIGADQIHRVRTLLDETFGANNSIALITFVKTGGLTTSFIKNNADFILWYCKDREHCKFHSLLQLKEIGGEGADKYTSLRLPDGSSRPLSREERQTPTAIEHGSQVFRLATTTSEANPSYTHEQDGRLFTGPYKSNSQGMRRLGRAERLWPSKKIVNYVRFIDDFQGIELTSVWEDIGGIQSRADPKVYAVQTATEAIKRCMLMTTDPGDLVLDPTCGSGSTAYVAEQWGRRWITIDTSRVALAIARQRILTAKFEHYSTKAGRHGDFGAENPSTGFKYKSIPHIKLSTIAQNTNLDAIFTKHEPILAAKLQAVNKLLAAAPQTLREKLRAKLAAKQKAKGKRSITEADRRRWILPPDNRDPKEMWTVDACADGWYEWEIPFDTDPDWPKALQDAVLAYRAAWRAKMDEVNRCITDNAEQEQLVDQPEVVRNVVRVSGPFTVEGVIPEELSIGNGGEFDLMAIDVDDRHRAVAADPQNLSAYLARMTAHLETDGLTFLNNKRKQFDHLNAIFEDGSGSFIHAEGVWDDDPESLVGVTFGPQYGSVTSLHVEEAIRAAKRYTDLVIAGFSFDAETYAIVEGQQHPKLRIHIAQIRPDLNDSMDGLLKNTPNSQLFTVFGQPDIHVEHTKEGWLCTLRGVDIYNPTDNTLRSSGADKVSAWFLDSDYDGRCFCATQAFFPNRDAWEKIAKALGDHANVEAFEAFGGTTSLPFEKGKFGRIAVKVIDPRGNEVMAIRTLK